MCSGRPAYEGAVVVGVLLLVAVVGVGVALRGLGGLVRRRRVVGGGVGVRAVGGEVERRAWCPQVIAIGGRRRSERTTRPFRGTRKLDNIACFSFFFFFQFSREYFPGGELK